MHLASSALHLPLTTLLFSLLAIRFNNASCIADEITRKLTNKKHNVGKSCHLESC